MKTPQPNTPGARLREARRALRWSQSDLSEVMGFSRAHITHMEQNTYRGGRASWEAAAKALNVSLDYLLSGGSAPGFSEQSPFDVAAPLPTSPEADTVLADLAQGLSDLLRAEAMPSDPRTVMRMALEAWRDFEVLPKSMSRQDRMELVLSEQRSAIAKARAALVPRRR